MPNPALPGPAATGSPDPLAALPPLATPAPLSWWPPAFGWWLLFIALLALLVAAAYWARPRWQNFHRHRQCKQSLAEAFQNARAQYQQDANGAAYLFAVNRALRSFALLAGKKTLLVQSADENWLRGLDALSDTPRLASKAGRQLLLQYHAQPTVNVASLHAALLAWSAGLRARNIADSSQRNMHQSTPSSRVTP